MVFNKKKIKKIKIKNKHKDYIYMRKEILKKPVDVVIGNSLIMDVFLFLDFIL